MRKSNTNLHFFLLAIGACVMLGLFYLIQIKAFHIYALISIFLLSVGFTVALILLQRKHQVLFNKSSYAFLRLYGDKQHSISSALVRKNISIFRLYKSSLYEDRSKVTEILSINGIGVFHRIAEKALSAWFVSCVLCTVSFFAANFFCALNPVALLGTLGANLVSVSICSMCFYKITSFKGEYIYKTLISLAVVVLQLAVFAI